MKKLILIMAVFAAITFASCDDTKTSDSAIQTQQEKMTDQGNKMVGMPGITNYQEKRNLKMIYELRDQEKLICYAYLYCQYTGKLVFIGKCMGYGIPYCTQYSSSQKLVRAKHADGTDASTELANIPMPQAEPNGLFMPESAAGTWVMLLDKKGEPHPVYVEPDVIVSPFELTIN